LDHAVGAKRLADREPDLALSSQDDLVWLPMPLLPATAISPMSGADQRQRLVAVDEPPSSVRPYMEVPAG